MALVEVKVPDIGDFDEVSVIELLVKPGDAVKPEQSLITVESDKASMEIPSSHAGVVQSIKVQLGDKVKQGSVIVLLEASAAQQAPAAPPTPAVEPKKPVGLPAPQTPAEPLRPVERLSDLLRRLGGPPLAGLPPPLTPVAGPLGPLTLDD
jgi:pyruvate/2-oxoglutarate dehydrogenase complex dihydrolipoamide acyltransferase (E2) component